MATNPSVYIDPATNESKFDIIRDTTGNVEDKNWLNRFCKDTMTGNIIYYCEAAEDQKLILHGGGKDGPVIATGVPCIEKEGYTDIHFNEPKFTVSFQHESHTLPFLHTKNRFEYNGKKYYWKDHHELVEEGTNLLLATFKASWLEGDGHRIGQLIVKGDGQDIRDIVVTTSLIVQERADEHVVAVETLRQRVMTSGKVMF